MTRVSKDLVKVANKAGVIAFRGEHVDKLKARYAEKVVDSMWYGDNLIRLGAALGLKSASRNDLFRIANS